MCSPHSMPGRAKSFKPRGYVALRPESGSHIDDTRWALRSQFDPQAHLGEG